MATTDLNQYFKQLALFKKRSDQQRAQFNANKESVDFLKSNLKQLAYAQTSHRARQLSNRNTKDDDHKTLKTAIPSHRTSHVKKALLSSHYQSDKHLDFHSMSNILRPELIDGCDKLNFTHPSRIQSQAIPRCLQSDFPNLIGQAHHGSGKTATFALIMLQRIDETQSKLQGLVVVHSRELANQTHSVFMSLGQFISGLKMILAIRGAYVPSSFDFQICIGTPGTLINRVFNAQRRTENGLKGFLSKFKILVVDEADNFLREQIKASTRYRSRSKNRNTNSFGNLFDQLKMITTDVQQHANSKFQTLLFSATYPQTVKHLAVEIAPHPIVIRVARKHVQLDNIRIFKIICNDETDKFNTLLRVISLANVGQMIIFVNSVQKAQQVIDGLESKDLGIACSALYGRGMDIKLRDRTMEQFRKNQTQCLVASNVIARGIDVPAVGLVVNFEIPCDVPSQSGAGASGFTFDSETFMHRVGRTGRFGSKGVCINLIGIDDANAHQRLYSVQKEYSLNIIQMNNTAKKIKESIANWLQHNI
eukprot:240875_1